MNWAIVVPQGDWLETYPTTNGRIVQGIRLAALYVAFILALIVFIVAVAVYGPAEKLKGVPWDTVDSFLQLLGWFIFGMIGVAVAQYVGKRATSKPEIVKAESDAKIAEVATGTFPIPAGAVLTKVDADTAAMALEARQGEIAAASADGAVG